VSRELDRRDFTVNRVTPAREEAIAALAESVSEALPGSERVALAAVDATTGNAARIVTEDAPAGRGDYVQRGLQHLQQISPALGLTATQPPEYTPDPAVQTTSSGAVATHYQQRFKGIPIFQAAQTVRFAPDGALVETVGSSITVPDDLPVLPKLSVEDAVRRAAEHVAVPDDDELEATDDFGEPLRAEPVDLSGFEPKVVATFADKADRPTVLEPGPFADQIKANLTWFPLDDAVRLAWEVLLILPGLQGEYRTVVDADSGEILYCRQLMQTVAARGNVFLVDGSGTRTATDFPRTLASYGVPVPAGLPAGFPDDWVTGTDTAGNSTSAHLDFAGAPVTGANHGGLLTFDPADPTGTDQRVLNIFYYCCVMHDYFYLFGFREADGNFQADNFGRGGIGSDSVDARAFAGPVKGTASMSTPAEGSGPTMNMGLVTSTNRHTALDSSVVFHEFTHGVTNRLVGGSQNAHSLESIQSRGMGEGWSDFAACTVNGTTVVGSWVVNRAKGIRGFPYDDNFPDDFGDLGTGRYNEVHNIGEIWCATLMMISRRVGRELTMQLVIDALKLTPANPSFLDARDAILSALDHMRTAGHLDAAQAAQVLRELWTAFAHFGMGPDARSNGAQLTGIVADHNLPPNLT
jgi:extracellular elastinolytic metalloproteinase